MKRLHSGEKTYALINQYTRESGNAIDFARRFFDCSYKRANGQPEIVPEEAIIVEKIFDFFLSGLILKQIVE